MCKHITNAQVAIRAPCCRKWFDCADCHADVSDHPLRKTNEMAFACKKCKKTFRKDINDYEEEDEFCPHCDNQYVLEAVTAKPKIELDIGDVRIDSRVVKDHRVKQAKEVTSMFDNELLDKELLDMMG